MRVGAHGAIELAWWSKLWGLKAQASTASIMEPRQTKSWARISAFGTLAQANIKILYYKPAVSLGPVARYSANCFYTGALIRLKL